MSQHQGIAVVVGATGAMAAVVASRLAAGCWRSVVLTLELMPDGQHHHLLWRGDLVLQHVT